MRLRSANCYICVTLLTDTHTERTSTHYSHNNVRDDGGLKHTINEANFLALNVNNLRRVILHERRERFSKSRLHERSSRRSHSHENAQLPAVRAAYSEDQQRASSVLRRQSAQLSEPTIVHESYSVTSTSLDAPKRLNTGVIKRCQCQTISMSRGSCYVSLHRARRTLIGPRRYYSACVWAAEWREINNGGAERSHRQTTSGNINTTPARSGRVAIISINIDPLSTHFLLYYQCSMSWPMSHDNNNNNIST